MKTLIYALQRRKRIYLVSVNSRICCNRKMRNLKINLSPFLFFSSRWFVIYRRSRIYRIASRRVSNREAIFTRCAYIQGSQTVQIVLLQQLPSLRFLPPFVGIFSKSLVPSLVCYIALTYPSFI